MTESRLELSIALSDNERTRPLIEGRVVPQGIRLIPTMVHPSEMFSSVLEMSALTDTVKSVGRMLNRAAGLDLGDRRGEDARGQDVPDEQPALVVHVVRDVQEIHVGDGDAHVRGLRAGQVAAERARAEVPEVVA